MPTPDMKGKHIVVQYTYGPGYRRAMARQHGSAEIIKWWSTVDAGDMTLETKAVDECYDLGAAKVELRKVN